TGVSVLIFDEFHERHLYGDIALARALDIQRSIRPDLKIVVMSATLDTDLVESHLRPCNVLTSQGRMFPVDIEYLKRETIDEPPWELAADAFAQAREDGGDVLIFMPGAFEIERTIVVSTNVAETSLTIDGVTLVIDSGLAKIGKYDPHRGINTLITEKISR